VSYQTATACAYHPSVKGGSVANKRQIKLWLLAPILLVAFSKLGVPQSAEKDIADLRSEVLSQDYYSLSNSWLISIYLPKEQYSRENLIRLWRYYCEKYPKKKEYLLDVRVYTEKPNADDSQTPPKKPRSFDAFFIRQAVGGVPTPGDNELMIYCPNLDKPEETKREVLAGQDPIP
jgi:hypothetical protein